MELPKHYIFMFVLDEELDSPAYPDDFQDVEVKDEPFEYDAVSCDFSKQITLMLILINLCLIISLYNLENRVYDF